MYPFKKHFFRIEDGNVKLGKIRFIASGNRPIKQIFNDSVQLISIDGRIGEVYNNLHLVPVVSANWKDYFSEWESNDKIQKRLKKIVLSTNKKNQRLRFWGAPDNLSVWKFLRKNGVSLINTDKPMKINKFRSQLL